MRLTLHMLILDIYDIVHPFREHVYDARNYLYELSIDFWNRLIGYIDAGGSITDSPAFDARCLTTEYDKDVIWNKTERTSEKEVTVQPIHNALAPENNVEDSG